MLKSNAFFKVLDIYKFGDKTQVFLLEIPETAIDLFENSTSNIEDDITKKARENFKVKVSEEPILELQIQEWKDRTEFPIGMNNKGELFYETDKIKSVLVNNKTISKGDISVENQIEKEKPWWKFW